MDQMRDALSHPPPREQSSAPGVSPRGRDNRAVQPLGRGVNPQSVPLSFSPADSAGFHHPIKHPPHIVS